MTLLWWWPVGSWVAERTELGKEDVIRDVERDLVGREGWEIERRGGPERGLGWEGKKEFLNRLRF